MGKELIDYPNTVHHRQQRPQPPDTRKPPRRTVLYAALRISYVRWSVPITDGSPWQLSQTKIIDTKKAPWEEQEAFDACRGWIRSPTTKQSSDSMVVIITDLPLQQRDGK